MTTPERIDGAVNPGRSTVEDMGVNPGGLYLLMTKELLDCSNILAPFQQVCYKRMPECITRGSLGQSSLGDGILHRFLNQ